MSLDTATIVLLTSLTALLMSLSMFVCARSYPPHIRGLREWAAANLGIGIGWIFIGLRGHIADEISITLGNLCITLGCALFFIALQRFQKLRINRLLVIGSVLVVTVAMAYWTYIKPDFEARVVVMSLSGTFFTFACGATALLPPMNSSVRPGSHRLTGIGFGLCSALMMARSLLVLLFGSSGQGALNANPLQTFTFLAFFLEVVLLSFGFLLMCNDLLNAELRQLATLDPLLKIWNRGSIEVFADQALALSRRTRAPISLMLLDIDHFKGINDRWGHATGDAALACIAKVVRSQLRGSDVLGRYGGEEFLIVLPNTSGRAAREIAERVRRSIENTAFHSVGAAVPLAASLGVVATDTPGCQARTIPELVDLADAALYRAKDNGRNRCEVWDAQTQKQSFPGMPLYSG